MHTSQAKGMVTWRGVVVSVQNTVLDVVIAHVHREPVLSKFSESPGNKMGTHQLIV